VQVNLSTAEEAILEVSAGSMKDSSFEHDVKNNEKLIRMIVAMK